MPTGSFIIANQKNHEGISCYACWTPRVSFAKASELQGLLNFETGYYAGKSIKHMVSAFASFARKDDFMVPC